MLHNREGWAIAHLLITHFRSFQKSDWAITRSFALLKRANEQSLFFRSFQKSNQKSDRSFALSKKATKRAIALSLFKKSDENSNRSFALSKRVKMSDCSFSKWTNAQPCSCRVGQSLICSSLISALFKRANEQSGFLALFAKEQMSDCSFLALYKRATKRAIALSLFQKEQQKEQSLFQ